MSRLVLCSLALVLLGQVHGLENGLARTPPMGWMHWQRYRCVVDCLNYPDDCVSEDLFKRATDALVAEGYAAVGYNYVIIDDCWLEKERDPKTQKLVPDRVRFPSGLNALANYIHGKGLKFGLYEDFGTQTCAGYPGVIDHMELDARTFAEWDVDYVKLDGCKVNQTDMEWGYPQFGYLLNKTGRPMVYSCSWPAYLEPEGKLPNYEVLKQYCNLWRNWDDIDDSFASLKGIVNWFADNQDRIQSFAGPGHWNDPDMLLLGNFGLSYEQSRLQMAIWAILAAPLIMSNDLAHVEPEIKKILLNRDIIAIDQDPLGIQGTLFLVKNSIEVWTRPVTPLNSAKEYSFAVAFASRRVDGYPYLVNVTLQEIGLNNTAGYRVTELFEGATLDRAYAPKDLFQTRVKPTGVTFYKFVAI